MTKIREIKCRAWDKIDKRMIDDAIVIDFQSGKFYNYYYFTPSKRSSDLFEKDEHGNYSIPIKNGKSDLHRYILMQHIGLNDCKGVEIYKSDIVSVWGSDYGESVHEVKYLAEQNYPAFDLIPHIDSEANGFSDILGGDYHKIEVIGNIWKNPKLLNEGTK